MTAFVEIVPAASAGQFELVELVARLAEQCFLSVHVRQVGMIWIVVKAKSIVHRGSCAWTEPRVGERIIAGRRETLVIGAFDASIKTSEHPLERPSARRREAQFLGELVELGGVDKV